VKGNGVCFCRVSYGQGWESAGVSEVAKASGDDEVETEPWRRMSGRCLESVAQDWASVHVLGHRSTAEHARWSCSLCHRSKEQEGWASEN